MSTWYNNAEVQRTVASFFIKRPGATVADLNRHMEACDKVRPSARHTYRVVARMMATNKVDEYLVGYKGSVRYHF